MAEPFPCHECGKVEMVLVTETIKVEGGIVVKNLPHYKCKSCNARLFDTQGVHAIQKIRDKGRRPHRMAA